MILEVRCQWSEVGNESSLKQWFKTFSFLHFFD